MTEEQRRWLLIQLNNNRMGGWISPSVNPNYKLWLDANEGKTGNLVSQWDDQTSNDNNAIQATGANQPADNGTYLTFDGGDFMVVADSDSLDSYSTLNLYAKFNTSSGTNFMGLIDKWISATSGYALYLDASKQGTAVAVLSKYEISTNGATALNTGVTKELRATIECTRKFTNKQLICEGEEPEVIKEGNTYYMFYDRWDGAQYNIYLRSDTSPYFQNSTETLILSNFHYCSILKDGSTYRLVVTDNANQNFILYTSTTINSGYTNQGNLITYGDVYDSHAIADPCEIKIGSTYYIYWSAFTSTSNGTIAYATSATGAPGSYTKQGTCIGNGAAGTFDLTLCADPEIKLMPDNTTYIMFYTGYNGSILKQQQGYATSSDGINWTKFANNPVHYFSGHSYETGTVGPNEPSILFENNICRMWYRVGGGLSESDYRICYTQFDMTDTSTLNAGSETVTLNIYVDDVLDGTVQLTGYLGIDYIKTSTQNLYIGGDNASTLYFDGNLFEVIIQNSL